MIDDRRMKEQESAEAISGLKNCHGNAKLTITRFRSIRYNPPLTIQYDFVVCSSMAVVFHFPFLYIL